MPDPRLPEAVSAAPAPSTLQTVWTVGSGLPQAWLQACGLAGQALDVLPGDAAGAPELLRGVPTLLQRLARCAPGPLLVRVDDAFGAAVFSALREAMRWGELPARPVHAFDWPPGTGTPTQAFRHQQLQHLARWAEAVGGHRPDAATLQAAQAMDAQRLAALDQLDALRSAPQPALSALAWHSAVLGALQQPTAAHLQSLLGLRHAAAAAAATAARPTQRLHLANALQVDPATLARLDALGQQVVGCDLLLPLAERPGPPPALGTPSPPVLLPDALADPIARAALTVQRALARGADSVHHVVRAGDEREPWFRRWLREACAKAGLRLVAVDLPAEGAHTGVAAATPSAAERAPPDQGGTAALAPAADRAPGSDSGSEGRSRKSLALLAGFSAHQRQWFQSVRERASSGEPFAVLNADAPQELLRAMDLPFVVNQWWASIVAAKQQSTRGLQLLRAQGYPTDAEAYSAQGLAAAFDADTATAPWGGLPRPGLLMAVTGTPATAGIFHSWAAHTGARLVLMDRTVDKRLTLYEDWWNRLPEHWDTALEADRLDLLQAQCQGAVQALEAFSGRRFDEGRLHEVMALVNAQEEAYRRTRDLVAQAPQAPVSIVDTMPAVMLPQWQRGTPWGVQAAQALLDEVQRRTADGQAACPGERTRLMWVGRGLWSRMGFYQQWEDSHGAVFVWSMYLGLAADGYLRHIAPGQSPMRALASRFVTMGDELRMPTWAGAWHVKEARLHRVDAAVAVDDADPLVLAALVRAGVPVLRLSLGNFGASDQALAQATAAVGRFLDGRPRRREE